MWANEKDMLGNAMKAPDGIFHGFYFKSEHIMSVSWDNILGAEGKKAMYQEIDKYFPKSHL